MRRNLPGGLVRDSVIVHRRLLAPAQFGLATRLHAGEPTWLDGALRRLGVPGGLSTLLLPGRI
ncbi:hypothetical protein [Frankia sp. CiP3]|uniref:hypothetical protein n=1 Tax=Frankia sp. CiP3 TaxID=2880971 RepID=UPI001EF61053|nr:hypothetical protein [Frankia sp. CiP3]